MQCRTCRRSRNYERFGATGPLAFVPIPNKGLGHRLLRATGPRTPVAEIEGAGGRLPPKATKNCINFLGVDPRLAHLLGHCWALPPDSIVPSKVSGILLSPWSGPLEKFRPFFGVCIQT